MERPKFVDDSVNLDILKRRAFNLRWATTPEGVIPLTAADPDFPCAPEIVEAIARYSRERYFSYGPATGLPLFNESVAMFFDTRRNVPANPDYIFPVDSAAFGIYVICKAFLKSGDEAIVFDPVDFLFRYSIETVGATAVPFQIPQQEVVNFQHLEELITPKTRVICLCNPLNPTGKVFTKQELLVFGEIACKYNLIILSDEIWSDIVFAPSVFTSIASLNAEIRKQTVTVTGFSKSYGLAGLRIGAVIASNKEHYDLLMAASLHQSTIHGANSLGQVAAATALNECDYWLNDFLVHLHAMRDFCVNQFNTIKGFNCIAPEGCYVAFPTITASGMSSSEMHNLLLNKAKVAIVPGLKEWFGEGAEGHIRISFATSKGILDEAFKRIHQVLD
ncbi:MAG: pyridoxal phosphate-dependent aminotransferase [Spirosomataceae bacterium]|nr:pyridoxal phosphate-dependent aminotransferase [Flectobacillus sp.]